MRAFRPNVPKVVQASSASSGGPRDPAFEIERGRRRCEANLDLARDSTAVYINHSEPIARYAIWILHGQKIRMMADACGTVRCSGRGHHRSPIGPANFERRPDVSRLSSQAARPGPAADLTYRQEVSSDTKAPEPCFCAPEGRFARPGSLLWLVISSGGRRSRVHGVLPRMEAGCPGSFSTSPVSRTSAPSIL
jgi:hypothetical protein